MIRRRLRKEYKARVIPASLRLFIRDIFSGESDNYERMEKEGPGGA
jgi:hypothetical protein